MFDTYLDRDYKYACALCICIYVTSAESTPVDRLLGFFFLWTAVRPVVGEPGVSLSPRSWLAYMSIEQLQIITRNTRYLIHCHLHVLLFAEIVWVPPKLGNSGFSAHCPKLAWRMALNNTSDMNDLALQIQRMFIICLSGRELFYPQDQCASASVRAHL